MQKSTSVLALTGILCAHAVVPDTREEAEKFLRQKFTTAPINRIVGLSGQTAGKVSVSNVKSATAVSGDWITVESSTACPISSPPTVSMGYEMGVCGLVQDTTNYYSTWACTQDDSTGDVVLTETRYTDSACTSGASVQTPINFTGGCNSGQLVQCPAGTTPYDGLSSTYSDGFYFSNFESEPECSNGTPLIGYEGAAGCISGVFYGEDSISIYFASDCSGTALFTVSYSAIASANTCLAGVMTTDDGDDDGDDDDVLDMILNYEAYGSVAYGADDDDDVCFHVETIIDYKGVKYTYEDLKAGKEAECVVPHSPFSRGVVVSTSCDKVVRVTDTHLLATTKGFQLAYSLKPGDILFGGYDDQMCVVRSVKREETIQQYFGLNCVHSEVLASGLRASTFGDFHTLPSWYMNYVGSIFGSESASLVGEYVAEWYFQK